MSAQKPRILAVDDEAPYRKLIKQALEMAGYRVDLAANGTQALRLAERTPYDLLLLDIMMPDLDGLALCRQIRAESPVPIIMLTALAAQEQIVEGLGAGADDYVTKPFGIPELAARVEAALRRARLTREPPAPAVRTGALEIDLAGGTVRRNGQPVTLTATEYRLLSYLARNIGRLQTYDQLLANVWGSEYSGAAPQLVHVAIRRLRAKIEPDPAHPQHITTRVGIGYLLAALPPE